MSARTRHGEISTRTSARFPGKLLAATVMYGGLLLTGAPFILAQRQCENDGSSAHYEESLSGSGSSMARTVTSATGCPNHVNYIINPNPATYTPAEENIPAFPMLMDEDAGMTDLSSIGGGIGIMFNGVALFSAYAAVGPADSYENSATALERDTFDPCGGHATEAGVYHYHNTGGCIQEQAMLNAGTTSRNHSPQLGWSFDGFPVYGQLGREGVEMLVCGNEGADDTYCLDSCNGYLGTMDGVDNFRYRYYLSCGFNENFFPSTTNCYRGCCPDGVQCSTHMVACGDIAKAGYTADYVPTQEERGLDNMYDSALIEGDDTDLIGTEKSLDCSLYVGSFGKDRTAETVDGDLFGTPAPSTTTAGPTLAMNDISGGTETHGYSAAGLASTVLLAVIIGSVCGEFLL